MLATDHAPGLADATGCQNIPLAEFAFRQMLDLSYALGARGKGGAAFNRIARIYRAKGMYAKALVYLQRALHQGG